MKYLYLELTKPRAKWKIASPLIRLFMGTDYSHCSIKFYSEEFGRFFHSEASFFGVDLRNSRKFEDSNIIVETITLEIPEDSMIGIKRDCAKYHELKKYDFKSLFLNALIKINASLGNPVRIKGGDGSKTVRCDEWLAYLFNRWLGMEIDEIEIRDIRLLRTKAKGSKYARSFRN